MSPGECGVQSAPDYKEDNGRLGDTQKLVLQMARAALEC